MDMEQHKGQHPTRDWLQEQCGSSDFMQINLEAVGTRRKPFYFNNQCRAGKYNEARARTFQTRHRHWWCCVLPSSEAYSPVAKKKDTLQWHNWEAEMGCIWGAGSALGIHRYLTRRLGSPLKPTCWPPPNPSPAKWGRCGKKPLSLPVNQWSWWRRLGTQLKTKVIFMEPVGQHSSLRTAEKSRRAFELLL